MALIDLFGSTYGLVMLGGLLLSLLTGLLIWKKQGLPLGTLAIFFLSATLLGLLGARSFYLLVRGGFYGEFFSAWPYAYAVSGAVIGVLLAVVLTGRITKTGMGRIADAASIPVLVMMTVARVAEAFSDFGWGTVPHETWLQRFPFSIQDPMWQEWHLAIFFIEAILTLAVIALVLIRGKMETGKTFRMALLWWAMTQVFCEPLRVEAIKWGFIPVQQLMCAIFGLVIGIAVAVKRTRETGRFPWLNLLLYLVFTGLVAFFEFALDKCPWPTWIDYAGMAASALAMGGCVQRLIDQSNKKEE